MTIPRRHPVAHALVSGLLAVAVISCSTSGKSAERADTTTIVDGQTPTTDGTAPEPTEPEGTTTTEARSDDLTGADLEGLLPTDSDLGSTWTVDTSESSSSNAGMDVQALEDACPEVTELVGDEDDDDEEVSVAFTDSDDRTLEVALEPSSGFESDDVDAVIDAIAACDTIEYTDDGFDISMDLSAERTDDIGDAAVIMYIDLTLEAAELPQPLYISATFHTFVVGPVSVTITATDGIDTVTFDSVPADLDLADELAVEMETRITDLLAG